MKEKIILFICACCFVLLQSCGTSGKFGKGTVGITNVSKPEIIVQPELREFLKNNPKPRIMLRVPFETSNVTTTESGKISEYNSLYGRIEKELMKVGYIVRDRSMLNAVINSTPNASYQEIGEKTQTDIILEIISISRIPVGKQDIDFQTEFQRPRGFGMSDFDFKQDIQNSIIIEKYIVDCKIVLVNSGTTVGMSTSNYCNCSKNLNKLCDVEFKVIRNNNNWQQVWKKLKSPVDSKWYDKLDYGIPMEDLSEMVANDLIKIFQRQ